LSPELAQVSSPERITSSRKLSAKLDPPSRISVLSPGPSATSTDQPIGLQGEIESHQQQPLDKGKDQTTEQSTIDLTAQIEGQSDHDPEDVFSESVES